MCRLRSSSNPASALILLGFFLGAVLPVFSAAPRLSAEKSDFLRSQADSAVDWMPWGAEAFARAQHEHKPVFLAVGAFTSELSRAMARQSFSNAETGAFLNDTFVCVLADAKEHPDVAALYQNYLQVTKQLSGPPMNLWLTPDLKPFEGANYLPPTEEWGKEGFVTVTKRVANAWKTDAAAQARKADEAVASVVAAQRQPAAAAIAAKDLASLLDEAAQAWTARYDATNGGFGDPPRYVEPELLRFLLRTPATREMALSTLRAVLGSPLRDPLDGGFFRYAADATWRTPYFQKLLSDQPRLALALLDAARISGDRSFAEAARGALNYTLDRLALAGGDFVTAEDASPESLTPSYFWTLAELRETLGDADAAEFAKAYGVTAAGNMAEDAMPGITTKGQNLLYRATPWGDAAAEKKLSVSAAKLLAHRAKRPPPRRDEGAIAGAHGSLLAALSVAGKELKDDRFVTAAKAEAGFIREHLLSDQGTLLRLSGRGEPADPADYAMVVEGLLTYSDTSGDQPAAAFAAQLTQTLQAKYWDADANRYYMSLAGAPGIWARVHAPTAGAGEAPCAESVMLVAAVTHPKMDPSSVTIADELTRTLAADVKNAADAVRGDVLLALRLAQASAQ